MKLRASRYNEVYLSEVAKYINRDSQIIRPQWYDGTIAPTNGVPLGYVYLEDGKRVLMYSDYSVRINNVELPLAKGDEEYFSYEIEINVLDY